jgi:hypothetical protein
MVLKLTRRGLFRCGVYRELCLLWECPQREEVSQVFPESSRIRQLNAGGQWPNENIL